MERLINGLSKITYKMLRSCAKHINTYDRKWTTEKQPIWVSGMETVQRGFFGYSLLYILGPRWNCAAMTASVGPLKVMKTINIDTENLVGADSWTLLVIDTNLKPVVRSDTTHQERILSFEVPEASYWVILRYYTSEKQLPVPEVQVDGKLIASKRTFVDEKVNYQSFLNNIKGNSSPFFRFLHRHVFALLSVPQADQTAMTKQLFLPLGSPETVFRFGSLASSKTFNVKIAKELSRISKTYLVFYNTASFPVAWHTLELENNTFHSTLARVFYLIRVVPKIGAQVTEEEVNKHMLIAVEDQGVTRST